MIMRKKHVNGQKQTYKKQQTHKSTSYTNLDSLEGSIQNLLSVLYPPFEATAPTLLSQLFQIIDSRYQGDALRCLLDFLVPAKHILDTVQQAACAQYSNVLFLCEGWPLCLRDQVVIHLAPINPLLLQPGDFYLQVAPFCDQSARIVVCSLLDEEELRVEVVEETPIPEISYPCIFTCDWLEELNQGRHGTPLSQCLLATEQGVVRLPWERVAVPDFVDFPTRARSSMASAPPSYPPLPSPLPHPPPLPHFPENSSSNRSFPLSSSKESAPKQYPATIKNSILTSPSHPSAFSVETRICPAKHGIAVSLCLVDTRAASSSRLVKVKETETEPKPVGWVSPNTWDNSFPGTDTTTKTSTVSGTCTAAGINRCKGEDKGVGISENLGQDKHKDTNIKDISRGGPADHVVAEGEYIDVLQATMLFGKAQSVTEEQQKLEMQMQPHTQMEPQIQRYLHRPAQMQPHTQTESYRHTQRQPNTQISPQAQSQAHVSLPTKPQMQSHSRSEASVPLRPNMSAETGPPTALHHSQSHHPHPDYLDSSQCVLTVRFSEKPCTPCMRRKQGGMVSRAQELRCRYRDSYQAAIQNPVTFGQETERGNMLAVVEEDGDFSQCDDRPETETEDPWCNVQGMWFDPGMQHHSPSSVSGAICKESGEKNTVPYWKQGITHTAPCMDYKGTNVLKFGQLPEQTTEMTSLPFREPRDAQSAKTYGNLPNVNGTNLAAGMRINTNRALSGLKDPKQSDVISAKHHGLPFTSSEISAMNVIPKPRERTQSRTNSMGVSANFSKSVSVPQNRRESTLDGRCSSLSTAVVDTSEKCELVIVEGQNVRRREKTDSCAEIPQLHVVKCKNSTAFRLVSPKINRRKIPDGAQPGSTSITSRTCHQTENPPQSNPPPAAQTQRVSQPASARPRPDHLPLGSPDPRAHPLYLGVAALTGGRDRTGRAIVELYGDHQGWSSAVTSQELFKMLLYFHSITRREIREAGMTIIFDAKKANPQPQLYKALMTFQKLFPFVSDLHEASSLLLRAISKLEEPQRMDTVQTVQQCMTDQRTLMRDVLEDSRLVSLQREGGAILARLRKESDLKYPHCEDLSDAVDSLTGLYNHVEEKAHVLVQRSNMSLEHLEYLLQLREMQGHFLQMQQWFNVEGERHMQEAESVEDSGERMEQILNSFTGFLIEANDRRHHAMTLVSEAERLQQSGISYPETEAFRTRVSTFKSGLEDFLCRAEACGRELQIMVNVCDFCEQATALASECIEYLDQSQPRIHTMPDQDQTATPPNQTNPQQQKQESGPSPASLCPSDTNAAHGPATSSASVSDNDNSILQNFQDRFLQFSPDRFQEVKAQASALRGSRGMRVWNIAWLKCQEARQQLQESMQDVDEVFHQQADSNSCCERHYVDVVSTNVQTLSPGGQSLVVQSTPGPRHPQWEGIVSGEVDLGKRRPILGSNTSNPTTAACSNITVKPEDHSDAATNQGSKVTPQSPYRSARRTERETRRRQASRARSERDAAALSQSHTVGCQWFPWGRGLGVKSVSQDSCTTGVATAGSSTPPEQRVRSSSSCSHHGQPSCRILQEAQKFQISRHGSFCSEDSCMSDQGAAGVNGTLGCKHSSLPAAGRYDGGFCMASPQESASNALRLQRVMEELVFTEREYVRSLGYILTHYLPLMDRPDIPQDLRGKRGVIFGNLEKLYDFHSHYFLPELEACQREPAMVARCFLRNSESFGLYALYSKNKPQSDALILHRRHDIFKRKQQELGDMMDLSSYLLRPIQRISKYSLLLQDMLTLAGSYRPKDMIQDTLLASSVCTQSVCSPGAYVPDLTSSERERERAEIQAATELVRFQMRHGNDLLTMDAIQECDVNLKEQGQLIRQDEFTVLFRKKKCVRRIFLFEDLVLFSKTKKTDIGNDVYVYKQSFKTSDIGMTHNSSLSSLCFEIWFRRRKSEDTYTLKASSMEVKKAWTTDLEKILWDQAAHSRELRMQERVFMGMGRKPFMDIQPSDAAICDRAISCALPGRIPVACCSHRGLEYPRPRSIGSGSTASTTLSQSSSSSGRGSLPPAGYPGNQLQGLETSPAVCSTPEAVTENELNNHHLHHHLHRNCEQWKVHHPLMDSSDTSAECINHFNSSDRSCLSAISGEVVDDSSSLVSQSSKSRPPLCRTPSLRRNSSPVVIRKRPGAASKPPHLANAQAIKEEELTEKYDVQVIP
ncbi:Pleckstrin -like proteiny domain-containing family G member 4B [Collichthys lucidus]|uniref:Pleckstrin-like proteiny domain-containing family G member 4B n=1 Tax=Collichthys lucidus TaxID=240159 RepID=A0A4U5US74_COLLU|nr:Pleckstrin -like proteiny domain-containing family G member 4B [Collichthys lucidus]